MEVIDELLRRNITLLQCTHAISLHCGTWRWSHEERRRFAENLGFLERKMA